MGFPTIGCILLAWLPKPYSQLNRLMVWVPTGLGNLQLGLCWSPRRNSCTSPYLLVLPAQPLLPIRRFLGTPKLGLPPPNLSFWAGRLVDDLGLPDGQCQPDYDPQPRSGLKYCFHLCGWNKTFDYGTTVHR